jgi:hypothetical protein
MRLMRVEKQPERIRSVAREANRAKAQGRAWCRSYEMLEEWQQAERTYDDILTADPTNIPAMKRQVCLAATPS